MHQTTLFLKPATTETPEELKHFEKSVAQLAYGTNLALSWLEDPVAFFFFEEFSGAAPPSQKRAATRVLEEEVRELDDSMKKHVEGKVGMLTANAWNNLKRQHLTAFMLTVDGQAYNIGTKDSSVKRKTADEAFDVLDTQLQCKLLAKYLWLISILCYAHQVNLVVGDLFKGSVKATSVSKQLLAVINWFLHHSCALEQLCKATKMHLGKILALMKPVDARWTLHCLAVRCLVKIKKVMRVLIAAQRAERLTALELTSVHLIRQRQ
ncbi:hypothetical protein JCM10213_003436 [Rhodosporidiobolus nylandii]